MLPACYLSPEGLETVKARAAALGEYLAGLRALRATAQSLDVDLAERRSGERRAANGGDRRSQDRRGLWTVQVAGETVIRPASGVGRFDEHAAEPTAFRLDGEFRGDA